MRVYLMAICLISFLAFGWTNALAAPAGNGGEKEYLESLMNAMASLGAVNRSLRPDIPAEAAEIITNATYLVYNTDYQKLEKYNQPLKKMGIESAFLIPPQWVDAAVCKYYGYTVASNPELQKAASEQGKHGFFTVPLSDGGDADYTITKMERLKNGVLRVSGTNMAEEPFKAYFAVSNCGGKPHWVLLRVIETESPAEEEDYFKTVFK